MVTIVLKSTEKFFLVYDPQTRSLIDNGDGTRLSYSGAQRLGTRLHAEQKRPMIILEAVSESEEAERPIIWRPICGGDRK